MMRYAGKERERDTRNIKMFWAEGTRSCRIPALFVRPGKGYFIILFTDMSVSYTHLDVYKRQE